MTAEEKSKKEVAVLGGGCFWCTEAVFLRLRGVSKVTSGYTGGTVPNPTYEQICTGRTGHAEVVRVEFDPNDFGVVSEPSSGRRSTTRTSRPAAARRQAEAAPVTPPPMTMRLGDRE